MKQQINKTGIKMKICNLPKGLFWVFPCLFALQMSAQKIAGDNKRICPGQTVTIGAGLAGYCYNWIGPGITDPTLSTQTVRPSSTTKYQVQALAEDFTHTLSDEVTVEVVDLISAEIALDKCCYQEHDAFPVGDFIVKSTQPPGMEKDVAVVIIPSTVPGCLTGAKCQDQVTVQYRCISPSSPTLNAIVPVTIVNRDFEPSLGTEIPVGAPIGKLKEAVTDFKKPLEEVADLIKKFGPCEPVFDFNVNFNNAEYYQCCPNLPECILKDNRLDIEGNIAMGIGCSFPIAAFPAVAVFVGCASEVTLKTQFGQDCNRNNEICVEGEVKVTISGGLATSPLSKQFYEVKVTLDPYVSIGKLKVCYPSLSWIGGKVCFGLDVSVSVKLISLVNAKYKFPIIPSSCQRYASGSLNN